MFGCAPSLRRQSEIVRSEAATAEAALATAASNCSSCRKSSGTMCGSRARCRQPAQSAEFLRHRGNGRPAATKEAPVTATVQRQLQQRRWRQRGTLVCWQPVRPALLAQRSCGSVALIQVPQHTTSAVGASLRHWNVDGSDGSRGDVAASAATAMAAAAVPAGVMALPRAPSSHRRRMLQQITRKERHASLRRQQATDAMV